MRASKLRVIVHRSQAKWFMGRATYRTALLPAICPKCGKPGTIAALPPPLLEIQRDGTTHVCVPQLGGCDWGFQYTPNNTTTH